MNKQNSPTIRRLQYLSSQKQKLIFEARSFIFQTVREILNKQGFVEVHLPSIAAYPTDPVKDHKKELFSVQWYNQNAYLIQSVQIHKQMLMAAGFSKVYCLSPFWRKEEKITPRHLSEAWSLDIEMAYISSEEEIMKIVEKLLSKLVVKVHIRYGKKLNITNSLKPPFPRYSYDEVIKILRENNIKIKYGEDLGYEREEKLGKIMKKRGIEIFFITRYPTSVKKFYTKLIDNSNLTRTFDLIWRGWEIASGAQRETNLKILKKRIKEQNLNLKDYRDFLDIFKFGAPPHGGCGIGMDRVVARILKIDSVEKVVFFPRSKNRLRP
jgi:aspartyl-tRNA synthetase